MDLEAKIGPFLPEEIFEFIIKSTRTGSLVVGTDKNSGKIFFKDGKPVHAIMNNKEGIEALYDILTIREGNIGFIADEKANNQTIKIEGDDIKGQIERRKKALVELKEKLPSFDTVPVKLSIPADDNVSFRKTDWKVMMIIDGIKSINDIIKESPLDIIETCQTLEYLFSKSLIISREQLMEELKKEEELFEKIMKEFGENGIGADEWKKVTENAFKEIFGDDEFIKMEQSGIKIEDNIFSEYSLPELEEKFEKVRDILYNKSIEEFGTMLARKKWNVIKG